MKHINIHTKKEDVTSSIQGEISPDEMKVYIFSKITFSLSNKHWDLIETAFRDYWNNHLGQGGYFYWDEVASFVNQKVKKRKVLLSERQINFIVDLMLDKIESDGGFME